jgi:hypothetical protein
MRFVIHNGTNAYRTTAKRFAELAVKGKRDTDEVDINAKVYKEGRSKTLFLYLEENCTIDRRKK